MSSELQKRERMNTKTYSELIGIDHSIVKMYVESIACRKNDICKHVNVDAFEIDRGKDKLLSFNLLLPLWTQSDLCPEDEYGFAKVNHELALEAVSFMYKYEDYDLLKICISPEKYGIVNSVNAREQLISARMRFDTLMEKVN